MALLTPCIPECLDPRVRRTREMLQRSLEDLLSKRDFEKISVGDIADAATLNRATFYAHFVDKFDLLEAVVATRFQELILSRGLSFDGTCVWAMYGIVLVVCDFLAEAPYCPQQRQVAQHMEAAMVTIVRGMIGGGLRQHPLASGADTEIVAATLAGAIYGAARQWLRTENRPDAQEAATVIAKLLLPMLTSGALETRNAFQEPLQNLDAPRV